MTKPDFETYGSFRMRAVGAKALKGARIFRSRALSEIVNEEVEALSDRFGIELVCDVLSQWEMAASPEPVIGGVRLRCVPSFV